MVLQRLDALAVSAPTIGDTSERPQLGGEANRVPLCINSGTVDVARAKLPSSADLAYSTSASSFRGIRKATLIFITVQHPL